MISAFVSASLLVYALFDAFSFFPFAKSFTVHALQRTFNAERETRLIVYILYHIALAISNFACFLLFPSRLPACWLNQVHLIKMQKGV